MPPKLGAQATTTLIITSFDLINITHLEHKRERKKSYATHSENTSDNNNSNNQSDI